MIIGIIVYLLIAIFTYFLGLKKADNTWFEKIVFSLFWPFLLIFYVIHYFHNK